MERLSNKIRRFRFKNDEMTQKALAGQVGVSRQTMNAIENGRHAPTVAVAIRIADVFGVTVDQLFKLDYDGKPANRVSAPRFAVDPVLPAAEKMMTIDDRHERSRWRACARSSDSCLTLRRRSVKQACIARSENEPARSPRHYQGEAL